MPFPLSNEYVDNLDDSMTMPDEKFNPVYAEQILESRNKIFAAMCKATGTRNNHAHYDELTAEKFMSYKSITKKMMAEWLETICVILNAYASPVLTSATTSAEELKNLKDEKISDQKTIIELQEKLIEKNEEELHSMKTAVQTTLQSEMKSYSTAVKTSCSKALSPKRVQAALKTVAAEEDRSTNLIFYGIEEKKEEKLEETVLDVLSHLNEKPRIVSCSRIGKDGTAAETVTCKPVRVKLSGTDHVRQILKKTATLRTVEGYTRIYICPDRTAEQRLAHKKLVEEMKKKKISEPGKQHYIRRNTVVSSDT